MVYYSLTEAPHNLKEGIDWLIALKGTDAESNIAALGAAVYDFLADKPVGFTKVPVLEEVKQITKEFMEQEQLKDLWPARELLWRFDNSANKHSSYLGRNFIVDESDHANIITAHGVETKDIAQDLTEVVDGCEKFLTQIKSTDLYVSAYNSEATWEASCSENPEDCAAVFVGIAPMLYAGLRSLRSANNTGALEYIGIKKETNLETILDAMGYEESDLQSDVDRSYILKALRSVNLRMLSTLFNLSGFWAFYGLYNKLPVAGLSVKTSGHGKARASVIAGEDKYEIPFVDVDMGSNSKFAKKPAKTDNALGSDNIYYSGVPTVADLGHAIPF
ncbi:hypothetical protein BBBOND_0301730 [Babesia bigemina]|uniref:Uncharacterized protein n=1 Tax=Babesia bigemina TaxID=5866 RepID=A0A061DBJ0_BABBI|nr:hypothetical protein BBBOND_0301730 [Babesia bigemina]CDR96269.1 hypothetical protein BBBOND_0301730 [Babesia bigemina]|eukprot:XP_012768455.1 hypothetical protein BBBOND_0301730 [Babesia bigemina]